MLDNEGIVWYYPLITFMDCIRDDRWKKQEFAKFLVLTFGQKPVIAHLSCLVELSLVLMRQKQNGWQSNTKANAHIAEADWHKY